MEIKGMGIQPNKSTCPLNARDNRHSGWWLFAFCPLYTGVTFTLDKCIWHLLSIIQRTFSMKDDNEAKKSKRNRTIWIRRSVGTKLSSKRFGKWIKVGATFASGRGGSKTRPACFIIGLDRKEVGLFTSKSSSEEKPSLPIAAMMRHPDFGISRTSWGRELSLSNGISCLPPLILTPPSTWTAWSRSAVNWLLIISIWEDESGGANESRRSLEWRNGDSAGVDALSSKSSDDRNEFMSCRPLRKPEGLPGIEVWRGPGPPSTANDGAVKSSSVGLWWVSSLELRNNVCVANIAK